MNPETQKKIDFLKSKCKSAEEEAIEKGQGAAFFLMDVKYRHVENTEKFEITPGLFGNVAFFDKDGSHLIIQVMCSDFHNWLKKIGQE